MKTEQEVRFDNNIDSAKELIKRLALYAEMVEEAGINKVRSSIIDSMVNMSMILASLCGDVKADTDQCGQLAS